MRFTLREHSGSCDTFLAVVRSPLHNASAGLVPQRVLCLPVGLLSTRSTNGMTKRKCGDSLGEFKVSHGTLEFAELVSWTQASKERLVLTVRNRVLFESRLI